MIRETFSIDVELRVEESVLDDKFNIVAVLGNGEKKSTHIFAARAVKCDRTGDILGYKVGTVIVKGAPMLLSVASQVLFKWDG